MVQCRRRFKAAGGAPWVGFALARAASVPAAALAGRSRQARVALARQVLAYEACIWLQRPVRHVAAALRRDPATVRHACRVVERWRRPPGRDWALGQFEAGLEAFAERFFNEEGGQ